MTIIPTSTSVDMIRKSDTPQSPATLAALHLSELAHAVDAVRADFRSVTPELLEAACLASPWADSVDALVEMSTWAAIAARELSQVAT